ncbi:MAG: tRNA pseudouridine(38-40) synthase TruA [Syntrophobacteraceae bacterium]|jgi:tRNA pseudouridine38-40 synthase|nr:tRNA pseudouridine(38-40) synthase TruA [Syntrophobacteraceae bacterium]
MPHYDLQQKRNFKLVLEYDGSGYHGWQRQAGVLTIQEVLELRIEIMLGAPIRVRGSGRTDAGVHARRQVANFYARTRLEPREIQRGLNSLLPPDIVVLEAEEVADSFHARFSATGKTYEYWILNRETPSALERNRAWLIRRHLMPEPVVECLRLLAGSHDFAAFMAAGSSVRSTERTLHRAELIFPDSEHWVLRFEANGFLRHMVRNLVGTLVDVGKGKLAPEGFREIMNSGDRRRAGMTAPAHGLFLVDVAYDIQGHRDTQGGEEHEAC